MKASIQFRRVSESFTTARIIKPIVLKFFYITMARELQGIHLENNFPEEAKTKEIIPANDELLYRYLWTP